MQLVERHILKGKLINADVNGSLNIVRLGLSALGNSLTKDELVLSCVSQPKKMNIFYQKCKSN